MQIVIDIPDNYMDCIDNYEKGSLFDMALTNAIKNGSPLPKGHGELIDRDKIEYLKAIHDAKYGHISWGEATKRIKYSAPTIIEADMAESED